VSRGGRVQGDEREDIHSEGACQWSEGFGLSILSYYKCEGQGPKDTFYALILPINIIIIIGTSVLLYTIWITADMVSVNLYSL